MNSHDDLRSQAARRDDELENLTADQIPPAEFATLVTMLASQALVALGAIPNPATGRTTPQPVLAKYYIGLLEVLEEKSQGNLTKAEKENIERTLSDLQTTLATVEESSSKEN